MCESCDSRQPHIWVLYHYAVYIIIVSHSPHKILDHIQGKCLTIVDASGTNCSHFHNYCPLDGDVVTRLVHICIRLRHHTTTQ